ncbi:hypothetical protein ACFY7H_25885 [Streptomyces sp. NPDC012794]|uniref:hypothetical protein n=1 Tax=Streptomyces sp. NPDC012794 TaxID=3364850 RepID=UPI00367C0C7F
MPSAISSFYAADSSHPNCSATLLLISIDLIIDDDIGLQPVSPNAAEGFYRLVDAACGPTTKTVRRAAVSRPCVNAAMRVDA